jgi:Helix-turn-helix of DDE superfamily endonuclease
MLNLERILNQDRLTRAMTGLNRKAFEELLPSFTEAYQQSLVKPVEDRKRALGGGRKATLRTMSEKLLYILLYCKCYPTFDLLSVLFTFDRSCAHDWVHRLLPILETTLGHRQVLPERQIRSIEEFLDRFPDVREVILDGTERPVQCPKNPEQQKAYYSC